MKHKPGLLATAIPAILTAAAVYVSLVYATKLTATFFDNQEPEQLLRQQIGVTHQKPVLEQAPPPSPEAVVSAFRAGVAGASGEGDQRARIILEPELEQAPGEGDQYRLSIQPVELGPIPNPINPQNAASSSAPSDRE